MRLLTKILDTRFPLSLRAILFTAALYFIAVEMDFDGFIFNTLGVNTPIYVEAEVVPYYERFRKFEQEFNKHPSHRGLVIMISDSFSKDSETAAYCQHDMYIQKIVINKKHWESLPDAEREVLVFHEIGHGLYDKRHKYDTIMEPRILFSGRYILHYDRYIKEFFNSQKHKSSFFFREY